MNPGQASMYVKTQIMAAMATIAGHVWTMRTGKRHRFLYCSRCGCSQSAARHFGWTCGADATQAAGKHHKSQGDTHAG